MSLVIKKTVDLSSLGEEYNGVELVFKSIPAKSLPELDKKRRELAPDDKDPDLEVLLPYFSNILETYFISGKQDDSEVKKEDIAELPPDALIYCFQIITGQTADPKALSESTTTSTTDTEPAEK